MRNKRKERRGTSYITASLSQVQRQSVDRWALAVDRYELSLGSEGTGPVTVDRLGVAVDRLGASLYTLDTGPVSVDRLLLAVDRWLSDSNNQAAKTSKTSNVAN